MKHCHCQQNFCGKNRVIRSASSSVWFACFLWFLWVENNFNKHKIEKLKNVLRVVSRVNSICEIAVWSVVGWYTNWWGQKSGRFVNFIKFIQGSSSKNKTVYSRPLLSSTSWRTHSKVIKKLDRNWNFVFREFRKRLSARFGLLNMTFYTTGRILVLAFCVFKGKAYLWLIYVTRSWTSSLINFCWQAHFGCGQKWVS